MDNGTFRIPADSPYPEWSDHCSAFMTPSEIARMEDYVKRNWSNCAAPPGRGCHETYHYADVSIARDGYKFGEHGTNAHDVVASIEAAVRVLQGKRAPAPYSIADKKEALFMLAHFVGDLHQPLHVGSIYLLPDGTPIDPDAPDAPHSGIDTAGGNFIRDHKTNLHAEWDHMPDDLSERPSPGAIQAARKVPATDAPPGAMAAIWASDTVIAAQRAFGGVSFLPGETRGWKAKFKNRKAYLQTKDELQGQQLIKGGARLAELLNAIWP